MSIRARALATAAAAASTAVLLATAQTNAALADANGCTSAPGYTGALNCVAVWGSGLHLDKAESRYQPGISPWPQQNCERTHEWRYRKYGSAAYLTHHMPPLGCQFGLSPDYQDWMSPGTMADGSTLCAHSLNSQTGFRWTPFACETITY